MAAASLCPKAGMFTARPVLLVLPVLGPALAPSPLLSRAHAR